VQSQFDQENALRNAYIVEMNESIYDKISECPELQKMVDLLVSEGFMDLAFEMLLSRM
jgi:hypothetical protein